MLCVFATPHAPAVYVPALRLFVCARSRLAAWLADWRTREQPRVYARRGRSRRGT